MLLLFFILKNSFRKYTNP